jgi:Na+/melibiose symporter-like transporter
VYYIPSIVHQQVAKLPPLIPSMRIASRTNEFRTIFTNRVLIGSATGIFAGAASFLFLIGFGLSTTSDFVIYSILLAVVGLIVSLFVNIGMNWLLQYVEKLRVYLILAATVTVLSTIAFIPANFSNTSAFVVLLIFTLILSIISAPIGLIESLMVRDLIVYDTFITGKETFYPLTVAIVTAVLLVLQV